MKNFFRRTLLTMFYVVLILISEAIHGTQGAMFIAVTLIIANQLKIEEKIDKLKQNKDE